MTDEKPPITVNNLFTPEMVQRTILRMAEQKFQLDALTKDWPRAKRSRWYWINRARERTAMFIAPWLGPQ